MIGKAMETWPDDALRRVCDAPVEKWAMGSSFQWPDGAKCLYGHAGRGEHWSRVLESLNPDMCPRNGSRYPGSPASRFDGACKRFGIPRTVRAIKQRALRILAQRDATLGEPARVGIRTGA